jgi:hypothetical protein
MKSKNNGDDYYQTDPLPQQFRTELSNNELNQSLATSYVSSEKNQNGINNCEMNANALLKCSNKTIKKTVFGKENCNYLSNVTQKVHSRLSNFYLDDSSLRSPMPFEIKESHNIPEKLQLITPGKAFTHVADKNIFFWNKTKDKTLFQKIDLNRPQGKIESNIDLGIGFNENTREFKERKSSKNIQKLEESKENIKPNEKKKNTQKRKKIKSKKLKKKLQKEKNNKLFEQEYRILEGKIKFPPTYKFFAGTSIYYLCNQRLPGYPDRIFYILKKNGAVSVRNLDYKSCFDIEISDHKPVYAVFELINRKNLVNTEKSKN